MQATSQLLHAVENYCPVFADMDGAILGGGFLRAHFAGEKPADFDIFFQNQQNFQNSSKKLEANSWKQIANTNNALTYTQGKKTVQLISAAFGTPQQILDFFDFTICKAVLFRQDNKFLVETAPTYFQDLARRRLVYTGSSAPLASLWRTYKFIRRGYELCGVSFKQIVADCQKLNLDNEAPLGYPLLLD